MDLATIWHLPEAKAVHEVVLSEGLQSPELVQAWCRGSSEIVVDALARYFTAQMRTGHAPFRPLPSAAISSI